MNNDLNNAAGNYGAMNYIVIKKDAPAEESFEAIVEGENLPIYVTANQKRINKGEIIIGEFEFNPLSLRELAQIMIEDEKQKRKK